MRVLHIFRYLFSIANFYMFFCFFVFENFDAECFAPFSATLHRVSQVAMLCVMFVCGFNEYALNNFKMCRVYNMGGIALAILSQLLLVYGIWAGNTLSIFLWQYQTN